MTCPTHSFVKLHVWDIIYFNLYVKDETLMEKGHQTIRLAKFYDTFRYASI